MKEIYSAVKVTDTVYWVGAIDWTIRDFHGYATSGGTTYNAYLVIADKVTLIDTVKAPFKDQLLSRISSVIDPSKIDYIISNQQVSVNLWEGVDEFATNFINMTAEEAALIVWGEDTRNPGQAITPSLGEYANN